MRGLFLQFVNWLAKYFRTLNWACFVCLSINLTIIGVSAISLLYSFVKIVILWIIYKFGPEVIPDVSQPLSPIQAGILGGLVVLAAVVAIIVAPSILASIKDLFSTGVGSSSRLDSVSERLCDTGWARDIIRDACHTVADIWTNPNTGYDVGTLTTSGVEMSIRIGVSISDLITAAASNTNVDSAFNWWALAYRCFDVAFTF